MDFRRVLVCVLMFKMASMEQCLNMELHITSQNDVPYFYIISQQNATLTIHCASFCVFNERCISFFFNQLTHSCILCSRNTADLLVMPGTGWIGFDFEDATRTEAPVVLPLELWVVSVTDFSSEYSADPGAQMIIGPYDVYPNHGDLAGTWAARNWSHGPEWIIVKIAQLLFVIRIDVYETYHPGGTRDIEAKSPLNTWHFIWTTPQLTKQTTSRINAIDVQPSFAADEFRITTDATVTQYWVEIDAVLFIGWPA